MLEAPTKPAYSGPWPQPDLEMTTDNRLIVLTMAEIAMIQAMAAITKQYHTYNPAIADRETLDDLLHKLDAQPTHKHFVKGTQLRFIGRSKRKNSEQVEVLYETPCRIVYMIPEAEWQERFGRI